MTSQFQFKTRPLPSKFKFGINQPSYELVDFCHSTNPGENLLHNYGVETGQLNPQHYFIPWITFDNVSIDKGQLNSE